MLTVLTQTSEAVNCMTAENTVSRSELAQAAGIFRACHSSSLGPQEARADGRECRADASLHRGVGSEFHKDLPVA
jgi:hypothetical protein